MRENEKALPLPFYYCIIAGSFERLLKG